MTTSSLGTACVLACLICLVVCPPALSQATGGVPAQGLQSYTEIGAPSLLRLPVPGLAEAADRLFSVSPGPVRSTNPAEQTDAAPEQPAAPTGAGLLNDSTRHTLTDAEYDQYLADNNPGHGAFQNHAAYTTNPYPHAYTENNKYQHKDEYYP